MEQQERRSLRVRTLQQTILEVTALNPDEAYVAHAPLLDGLDPWPWPARDQRRVHAPSRASGWQLPQTAAIKTLWIHSKLSPPVALLSPLDRRHRRKRSFGVRWKRGFAPRIIASCVPGAFCCWKAPSASAWGMPWPRHWQRATPKRRRASWKRSGPSHCALP